jgi:hypothetical protein
MKVIKISCYSRASYFHTFEFPVAYPSGWTTEFDFWQGFFLRHRIQTGSGVHPASCTMGTGGSFTGGKAADYSPPSIAEVKNAQSYICTPSYIFMEWCLINQKIRLDGVVFG